MSSEIYSPKYSASRALIVGINNYQHASPLGYAVNDAHAIAELLINNFGFDQTNVIVIDNTDATRANIIDSFLSFTTNSNSDDRIIFFFAGHGHTLSGRRGEVGFLVPYDGNPQNVSTLIRWDELTSNGELIPAKHMLFIMDACYGGLAITRSLPPGSMRFLKDMLLRYSRQVLTAGKANEVVADSGGPIPHHSVFTGHLIEALQGKASSTDGIITANGVMAYVYSHVGKDQHSHQTPHYGFIDGDGDLIFKAPILESPKKEEKKDEDFLIAVPSSMHMTNPPESSSPIALAKEYLSDSRHTIKLHDLISQELREVLLQTSEDNFMIQGKWSLEEFTRRLKEYERILYNLQRIMCCVAYWGKQEHMPLLKMAPIRLRDRLESKSGLVVWQALRWYPIMLLFYTSGISALASEKYDNLAAIFLSRVPHSPYDKATVLVTNIGDQTADLHDAFKELPGHERQYVPRSEYLFKLLQPMLDDLLFLGGDYELHFDRFELLFSMVYADIDKQQFNRVRGLWTPIGRFGWKLKNEDTNPLHDLLNEANTQKESWAPLKAGLFGGDYTRFKQIADEFTEYLSRLSWR
ncbi:MAG: caspase family protein [Dehalococcoidales bacterium]|nr:caspase family protein [Dehalococcoidales bacterium]